ncbi:hypothetical protein [Nocardiopsis composta]|uniref:Uncharacterized protein n=1 Tax=Nocardiopsis composta TaxID=157465 RepID=A0A7W8QQ25_9ACTN|nr:hypothetical protein [Nocardiopsis composta]MBB5433521.1 hypothetical protein [Nocardiopsis composta]
MPELKEHAGRRYAVVFHYALHDGAWCVELSEAAPAPEPPAGVREARTHLPGVPFLVAVVPDGEPGAGPSEPVVHLCGGGRAVPYPVLRWFMEKVDEHAAWCAAAPDPR